MRSLALASLLALLVGQDHAAADDASDIRATVTGFYQAYESFRPPDGIPGDAVRKRFEPFITPALDALLIAGTVADARYRQVTNGMYPPLIEGDVFTPNFEGASSFDIGACAQAGAAAHCAVAMTYNDARRPVTWTDTVSLARTPAGWRVDDIAYGQGGGSLVHTLTDAIGQGNAIR